MKNKPTLFLVDDDPLYLKSLEIEFANQQQYHIKTFATGELCIENLHEKPMLVILDYHLNGIDPNAINGIETLKLIKKVNLNLPVIMLSSQDKIEVAINCMHHQAFDYVVKSETAFYRLGKIISSIMQFQKIEKELNWYMERM
ncbi:MAG TPA: response regulator [Chitinophagaceae bacterium]|mgnify:CR=1 FL=1|nr:response regulator [Chitinophagaceae bacterium]